MHEEQANKLRALIITLERWKARGEVTVPLNAILIAATDIEGMSYHRTTEETADFIDRQMKLDAISRKS